MARRLLLSTSKFILAVVFMVLAAPQLGTPTVQAKDGTGLDKVTWSGTIRIDSQTHDNQTSNEQSTTETTSLDRVEVTEFTVRRMPHEAGLTWGSSDVSAQVRSNETLTSRDVANDGAYDRNSKSVQAGSGSTTGGVLLILRGEGGTGKDTCWLETASIGQRDDGGQVTKPVDYPGTEHDWGVDDHQSYDVTKNLSATIGPDGVRMEIPCAKDARSLSGSQVVENSGGWVERVTYNLHEDGQAETEVELVPAGGFSDWLPQAGQDEKTIGNSVDVGVVAHTEGDPSLKPPKKVLKYTITLEDTSKEKGVDSNWPKSDDATTDFDMQIDPNQELVKVTDDKGQAATVNQQDVTEFRVRINSYDWGGYTKLKVVAELEGGDTVVAHVRGHSDQDSLAIPKDDNQNHIADGWEDQFGLENTAATADDDDAPAGDGHNGDSIVLYDEYRGFHISGKHERLSPNVKDLFILDLDKLGSGIYAQSTQVRVHLINENEVRLNEGGAGNREVITPNGDNGESYAILVMRAPLQDGDIGWTNGGPSVPRNIRAVIIDASAILATYGTMGQAELSSTIAHELGHATNVWHHGEQPPDYKVGDVTCALPDGKTAHHKANGDGMIVAAKGGSYSGNDACIMRYDDANFYENKDGNCHWQHGGATVHGFVYGQDPPGTTLCPSGKGTGVNDPDGLNKAGDASAGRGECIHKFCLKNSAH